MRESKNVKNITDFIYDLIKGQDLSDEYKVSIFQKMYNHCMESISPDFERYERILLLSILGARVNIGLVIRDHTSAILSKRITTIEPAFKHESIARGNKNTLDLHVGIDTFRKALEYNEAGYNMSLALNNKPFLVLDVLSLCKTNIADFDLGITVDKVIAVFEYQDRKHPPSIKEIFLAKHYSAEDGKINSVGAGNTVSKAVKDCKKAITDRCMDNLNLESKGPTGNKGPVCDAGNNKSVYTNTT